MRKGNVTEIIKFSEISNKLGRAILLLSAFTAPFTIWT